MMGTWIIGMIVFGVIILISYRIYRNSRTKGGCEGCKGCGMLEQVAITPEDDDKTE